MKNDDKSLFSIHPYLPKFDKYFSPITKTLKKMCQNTNCAQDYSLLTANTGVANLKNANPNLDGTGSMTTVITASANGTIVKSVTIKATGPVTTGMIRLFIEKTNPTRAILLKEIQIPIAPALSSTPTPTPVLPTFETILMGDLKLEAGTVLKASTQNAQSFNVIADALDWEYPSPLPSECCNFKQVTAVTGVDIVSTANPDLDGSGTIVSVLTAPNSASSRGTYVSTATIKALESTNIYGMIRFFISKDGGSTFSLMKEEPIPQAMQSSFEPSLKRTVNLNFFLEPGEIIGVSTQNSEKFGITIEGEEWSYPI